MREITVVKNDTQFPLEFIIRDGNGVVVDLTDYTVVKFKMAMLDATTCKIIGDCTVTDAPAGACYYSVLDTELDTVGKYEAEIQITYSSGRIITARGLIINVIPELPAT